MAVGNHAVLINNFQAVISAKAERIFLNQFNCLNHYICYATSLLVNVNLTFACVPFLDVAMKKEVRND